MENETDIMLKPISIDSSCDLEKADSALPQKYGTFVVGDDVDSEKVVKIHPKSFARIIFSLVASVLVVGFFTICAFVLVSVLLG